MASPMPVLPLVASITVWPGLSRPVRSASSMTPSARRSLTEPKGLNASILTKRFAPGGASRLIRTTGVLPTVSRMFWNLRFMACALDGSPQASGFGQRRDLVEGAQDLVAGSVRHGEQHALDAGLAIGLELFLVGGRGKHRDRQGLCIASGRSGGLVQALHRALGLPAAARAREPAVAELDHALQGVIALAAEQHRRMRSLLGLGIEPDRIEVDELAVEFGLLLGPQLLHGECALAQQLEAVFVFRAVVLPLVVVPAAAH